MNCKVEEIVSCVKQELEDYVLRNGIVEKHELEMYLGECLDKHFETIYNEVYKESYGIEMKNKVNYSEVF